MANKLEVDFQDTLRQLAELNQALGTAGTKLDNLEGKNKKISEGTRRLIERTREYFSKLESQLVAAGGNVDQVSKALERSQEVAIASHAKMAVANLNATTAAKAYRGELRGIDDLLNDTASKQSYVKWSQKTALITDELKNSNKYLQKALSATDSSESKLAQTRMTKIAGYNRLYTTETRQMLATKQLTKDLELQGTKAGESNAVLQARIAVLKQTQQEDVKAQGKLGQLRRAYESLDGGIQAQIVRQAEMNKGRVQAIVAQEQERNKIAQLRREIQSLNGGMQEQIVHLQQQKAARQAEVVEESKQQQKLAELERQLRSLNGGTAEAIARQQEMIRQRKEQIVVDQRAATGYQALGSAQKASTVEGRRESEVEKEKNRQRQHAIQTLERLRTQMHTLTGAHAAEIAQLERSIAQQKRYNALLAMSTSELLGFAAAKQRMTGGLNAANQSGAVLRATLAGLQTSIGMYTSSTILAAAGTYAVARAMRSSIEVGAEFGATMSRVQAIMANGMGSGVEAGMAAMEGQVRALGQTTMYTASEVADGLKELGMAGMTATQAMVGLQPALDLAQIGAISMGESADIATNVMMTFNLQARDLTHVVNVMATAITNSNTTISQLANAISYVGPAAKSAGISLEDVTAAVETLANSGIKSSRAGTGLRRMLVNMLNPTKKGAEMLERFGISIQEASGHTRSMTSILGQLHSALYADGVEPAERLAAVVDLVGVRASSTISALIGAGGPNGGFGALRRQLEDVTGAAERMRETIQDNLAADWKQVVSSFQEVQLTAMESQEMRLREAAMTVANLLVDLTKPIEDGSTLTQLDLILARVENIAKAIAMATGGYVGYRLVSGLGASLTATSAALQGYATRLGVVSAQTAAASAAQRSAAVSVSGMGAVAARAAVSTNTLSASMGRLAGTAGLASAAVAKQAANFGMLFRLTGLGLVIGGVSYALSEMWSFDSTAAAEEQARNNANLQNSYKSLKESIEETGEARKRASLVSQKQNIERQISEAKGQQAYFVENAKLASDNGLDPTKLQDQAGNAALQVRKLEESLLDVEAALKGSNTTQLDSAEAAKAQVETLKTLVQQENRLRAMRDGSGQPGGGGFSPERIEEQAAKVDLLRVKYEEAGRKILDVQEKLAEAPDVFGRGAQEIAEQLEAQNFDRYATEAEKYAKALERVNELEGQKAEIEAAQARMDRGEGSNQDDLITGLREVENLQRDLLDARKEEQELANDLADTRGKEWEAAEAARQKLLEYGMSEEEQLSYAQEMYVKLNDELAMREILTKAGADASVHGLRSESELLEQILRYRQQMDQIRTRKDKPSRKDNSAERERQREIDSAKSTYENLRKEFAPTEVAAESLKEKLRQLQMLKEANEISAEDLTQATYQLRLEQLELAQAQNKNLESWENLRDSYLTSPYAKTSEDLAELNRLLDEGAISLEQYSKAQDAVMAKSRADVVSGAPTADLRAQNGSGSPLNEWMSTEVDRAEGYSWYSGQKDSLFDSYETEANSIHEQAAAKQAALEAAQAAEAISAEDHAQRMQEIEQDKNRRLLAAQQQFGQQSEALDSSRVAYTEQMNQVAMISMMGTAQSMLGMFASASEEATGAQKAAFVAQKALAVAQIIMYAHLAAARASGELGPFGIPLGAMLLAQGYASAALVGALAVGQLASGGSGGGGGSSYAGNFDNGGNIAAGKWGIVGEYGPEMVHGPAYVTGRRRTADKLGSGGGGSLTISPEIHVHVSGESDGGDPKTSGKVIGDAVKTVVISELQKQMRPNGMLDQWARSNNRG